jgi:hypothetical protein
LFTGTIHFESEVFEERDNSIVVPVEFKKIIILVYPKVRVDLDIFFTPVFIDLIGQTFPVLDLGLLDTVVYTITLKIVLRTSGVNVPRHSKSIYDQSSLRHFDFKYTFEVRDVPTGNIVSHYDVSLSEESPHLIVVWCRVYLTGLLTST